VGSVSPHPEKLKKKKPKEEHYLLFSAWTDIGLVHIVYTGCLRSNGKKCKDVNYILV
jgi:hypothetical protein